MSINYHEKILESLEKYLQTQDFKEFKSIADSIDKEESDIEFMTICWLLSARYKIPKMGIEEFDKKSDFIFGKVLEIDGQTSDEIYSKIFDYAYNRFDICARTLERGTTDNSWFFCYSGDVNEVSPELDLIKLRDLDQCGQGELNKEEAPQWIGDIFQEVFEQLKKNRFPEDNEVKISNVKIHLLNFSEISAPGTWNSLSDVNEFCSEVDIYLDKDFKDINFVSDDVKKEIEYILKIYLMNVLTHELSHAVNGLDPDQYEYYSIEDDRDFLHPNKWGRINETVTELDALMRGQIKDFEKINDILKNYSDDNLYEFYSKDGITGDTKSEYFETLVTGSNITREELDQIKEVIEITVENNPYSYYSSCSSGSKYDPYRKAVNDYEIMLGNGIDEFESITDYEMIKEIILDEDKGRKTWLWTKYFKNKEERFTEDEKLSKDKKLNFEDFSNRMDSSPVIRK